MSEAESGLIHWTRFPEHVCSRCLCYDALRRSRTGVGLDLERMSLFAASVPGIAVNYREKNEMNVKNVVDRWVGRARMRRRVLSATTGSAWGATGLQAVLGWGRCSDHTAFGAHIRGSV